MNAILFARRPLSNKRFLSAAAATCSLLGLCLAPTVADAVPAALDTILVNRANGLQGEADNGEVDGRESAVSRDGRYVAFVSSGTNLTDQKPGTKYGSVFLRDTQTGVTTLVSKGPGENGEPADEESWGPTISDDGRYVGFVTWAENLSDDAVNSARDSTNAYVRDMVTNELALVSRGPGITGEPLDGHVRSLSISGNGHKVAFNTDAANSLPKVLQNLPPKSYRVFVRNLQTGDLVVASVSSIPGLPPSQSFSFSTDEPVKLSRDGNCVVFESDDPHISTDDDNLHTNIYMRDVARGETLLVSREDDPFGAGGNGDSVSPSVSEDGRYVAFASDATRLSSQVSDDTKIFVRDTQLGRTTLVSRESGLAGDGADDDSAAPSIDASGRHVAFESNGNNLSKEDFDKVANVFVRDLLTGGTMFVSRESGTFGPGGLDHSFRPTLSGDGRHVVFTSGADNLSTEDRDNVWNLFSREYLVN